MMQLSVVQELNQASHPLFYKKQPSVDQEFNLSMPKLSYLEEDN
jgi:hypothetical protein